MKAIYNKKSWILCSCINCGRLNYCEPHGTTAKCVCSAEWTEHKNLPYTMRDMSGVFYIGPKRIVTKQ